MAESREINWEGWLKKAGVLFLTAGGLWFLLGAYSTYKITLAGQQQLAQTQASLQQQVNSLVTQLRALKNPDVDKILNGGK